MLSLELVDIASRPDLWAVVNDAPNVAWPEFMMHDQVAALHWHPYLKKYPQYSWALLTEDGRMAAQANAIPVLWDGTLEALPAGWDAALTMGLGLDATEDNSDRALCALGVTTHPEFQGQSLGKRLLQHMKGRAKEEGYRALISPMRPMAKHKYPAMKMEEYLERKNAKGQAEDPWLRTHLGLGAQVLKVCGESMRIEGTLQEWKQWTGVEMGGREGVEVPGGLVPVQVMQQDGKAVYVEPNVWIKYEL